MSQSPQIGAFLRTEIPNGNGGPPEVSIPSNRGISSDSYPESPCQSRDESFKTTPTPSKSLPVDFLDLNFACIFVITY